MSNLLDDCIFLTVENVNEIHAEVIETFGGSTAIRDISFLESAVAAPQAGFGGKSVYSDVVEIAAAYLFYICRNHPYIDGNKRAAIAACILFLRINGCRPLPDSQKFEDLTLDVADCKIDRLETTVRIRKLIK